jgi:hypothetical protein
MRLIGNKKKSKLISNKIKIKFKGCVTLQKQYRKKKAWKHFEARKKNYKIFLLVYYKKIKSLEKELVEVCSLLQKSKLLHKSNARYRTYPKFDVKPTWYLISLFDESHYKPGVSINVNHTFNHYRRLYCHFKIHKLYYFDCIKEAMRFEILFGRVFEKFRENWSHEQYSKLKISDILFGLEWILRRFHYQNLMQEETVKVIEDYNSFVELNASSDSFNVKT